MTTSADMTEAAGATMLVPNAVTLADPTTPLASPLVSWLLSPTLRPPMHDARPTLPVHAGRPSRNLSRLCRGYRRLTCLEASYQHGGAHLPRGTAGAWARLTGVSMPVRRTTEAGQPSTWSCRSCTAPRSGSGRSADRR